MDDAKPVDGGPTPRHFPVRAALASRLEQLGDDELDSLTRVAEAELEILAENRLPGLLSTAQLEQFEDLIDAGDNDEAALRLARELPNCREITAAIWHAPIDETVERINEADRGKKP